MKMRCHRRLLGISYKEQITNDELRRRIENAIRPHVDLLAIVRQRKLKWYGHTTRSSGLAKTIMQGTDNGGRRRGRQKKRWEDNLREWTELELRNTLRIAEDREEWKAVLEAVGIAASVALFKTAEKTSPANEFDPSSVLGRVESQSMSGSLHVLHCLANR
ncbi:eukaryotic translation initiation factor 3 subunit F [Elysia marginata]|uniref:Eukaryotic translation initiation factor 3 subunit F n=1 Tax=Elysia marginata TaxID=1093978 RepID=A0AAV4FQ00_9GAST|nr:eukaryotic translation initiation factor 3 subunit F [Elysia marginata]